MASGIPTELVFRLYDELALVDIVRLMLVCSQWRTAALQHCSYCSDIWIDRDSVTDTQFFLLRMSRAGRVPLRVAIRLPHSSKEVVLPLLNAVADSLHMVTHLTLDLSASALAGIQQPFLASSPLLKEFSLNFTVTKRNATHWDWVSAVGLDFTWFAAGVPLLSKLRLTNVRLRTDRLPLWCTQIEDLTYGSTHYARITETRESVERIVSAFPNARSLRFAGDFPPEGDMKALRSMKSVELWDLVQLDRDLSDLWFKQHVIPPSTRLVRYGTLDAASGEALCTLLPPNGDVRLSIVPILDILIEDGVVIPGQLEMRIQIIPGSWTDTWPSRSFITSAAIWDEDGTASNVVLTSPLVLQRLVVIELPYLWWSALASIITSSGETLPRLLELILKLTEVNYLASVSDGSCVLCPRLQTLRVRTTERHQPTEEELIVMLSSTVAGVAPEAVGIVVEKSED
ncbi:hypothetical protein BKA62DRAFT_835400 [Auriculariales sp. MPI-PUGE-AT-0066]|nr:hypothetical protein BKA62DRAFT_835400 [Auriculariales sp. MPI-PUGE-AT-0066]